MPQPWDWRTTARIVQWLIDVERAYMSRVGDISGGEFDFEPLKGETAGEPIYLTRLSPEALTAYGSELQCLSKQLPGLGSQQGAGFCILRVGDQHLAGHGRGLLDFRMSPRVPLHSPVETVRAEQRTASRAAGRWPRCGCGSSS